MEEIAFAATRWTPLVLGVITGTAGIVMRFADNARLRNRPEPYYAAGASLALCAAFTLTNPGTGAPDVIAGAILTLAGLLLAGAALKRGLLGQGATETPQRTGDR